MNRNNENRLEIYHIKDKQVRILGIQRMRTLFPLSELENEPWNKPLFSWTIVEHSVTEERYSECIIVWW